MVSFFIKKKIAEYVVFYGSLLTKNLMLNQALSHSTFKICIEKILFSKHDKRVTFALVFKEYQIQVLKSQK